MSFHNFEFSPFPLLHDKLTWNWFHDCASLQSCPTDCPLMCQLRSDGPPLILISPLPSVSDVRRVEETKTLVWIQFRQDKKRNAFNRNSVSYSIYLRIDKRTFTLYCAHVQKINVEKESFAFQTLFVDSFIPFIGEVDGVHGYTTAGGAGGGGGVGDEDDRSKVKWSEFCEDDKC